MSNYDVVDRAIAGKTYENGKGAFWTKSINNPGTGYDRGYLPRRLADILGTRVRGGHVSQIIYSYATPVAWRDGDVWIVPDVRYSITTSSKHQSQLYKLSNSRSVPWDASIEEYERVVAGLMRYRGPVTRNGFGSYVPA